MIPLLSQKVNDDREIKTKEDASLEKLFVGKNLKLKSSQTSKIESLLCGIITDLVFANKVVITQEFVDWLDPQISTLRERVLLSWIFEEIGKDFGSKNLINKKDLFNSGALNELMVTPFPQLDSFSYESLLNHLNSRYGVIPDQIIELGGEKKYVPPRLFGEFAFAVFDLLEPTKKKSFRVIADSSKAVMALKKFVLRNQFKTLRPKFLWRLIFRFLLILYKI
jgi:hypothetical protein